MGIDDLSLPGYSCLFNGKQADIFTPYGETGICVANAEAASLQNAENRVGFYPEEKVSQTAKMSDQAIGSYTDPAEVVVFALAAVGAITLIVKAFTHCKRKTEYKTVLDNQNVEEIQKLVRLFWKNKKKDKHSIFKPFPV